MEHGLQEYRLTDNFKNW